MNLMPYNAITGTYTQDTEVEVQNFCNGYVARNTGDTIVFVNGVRLLPAPGVGLSGESISVGGNLGEIYKGRIQVRFNAPLGAAPTVEITQKFYLTEKR